MMALSTAVPKLGAGRALVPSLITLVATFLLHTGGDRARPQQASERIEHGNLVDEADGPTPA
jgi:hypothetical protein